MVSEAKILFFPLDNIVQCSNTSPFITKKKNIFCGVFLDAKIENDVKNLHYFKIRRNGNDKNEEIVGRNCYNG